MPTALRDDQPAVATFEAERRKLRKDILAARDRMPDLERQAASSVIAAKLWRLPELVRARSVFCFVSFRSEPATLPFIRECLARGKRVAVPRTVPGAGLDAFLLSDPETELGPGYRGIPEPDPERCPRVSPSDIDVVILPGSVFDQAGGRLGYGGGYYDRFCANAAPQAFRVAIAFERQVVPRVPAMPHDQPVHALVTEERIVRMEHGKAEGRSREPE